MSYNLADLDAIYGGRPETILRIKAYREQHGGTIGDAVEALRQTPRPITPAQIRTAILVLRASVAEQLGHIDPALRIDLNDAIDLASYGPIDDDPSEYGPPGEIISIETLRNPR